MKRLSEPLASGYSPGFLRGDISLVDSTLKEGVAAASTLRERLKVALYDDEVGIDVIEMLAPYTERDAEMIRLTKDAGLARSKLMLWNRLRRDDLDLSLKYDPEWIGISVDPSDMEISKFGRGSDGLTQICAELVGYAHRHGVRVSLHVEDSTTAQIGFLEEMVKNVYADKFRDCDSVGVLTPQTARERMARLTSLAPKPFEVHYHNHHGLAVQNTLSALAGGASWISATWGGLGAGVENPPMEQILPVLQELYGVDRFDLAEASKVCRSLQGLLEDRQLYEPYSKT